MDKTDTGRIIAAILTVGSIVGSGKIWAPDEMVEKFRKTHEALIKSDKEHKEPISFGSV